MSRRYIQIELILKKLNAAEEIISYSNPIHNEDAIYDLLSEAHEIWCDLGNFNYKNDVAMRLWDLSDNLNGYFEYYDSKDDNSLNFLIEELREISRGLAYELENLAVDDEFDDDGEEDSCEESEDEAAEESAEESEEESEDEVEEDKNIPLTKEKIREKRNNIFKNIDLESGYYGIKDEISSQELNSDKWKTYLYLRKCVLDYRNDEVQELTRLINFLKNKKNKKWLSAELLDETERSEIEKWGSGYHEWLERSLILEVLRRSAGMVPGVEMETSMPNRENFDWLYVQARLRTPTKYLFFKMEDNFLQEGHCGAIKPDLNSRGFSSKKSPGFHKQLEEAFKESIKLTGFLQRVHNIFKRMTVSGKKSLEEAPQKRYLVDGTETDNEEGVNIFRVALLRPQGYDATNQLITFLLLVASKNKESLDQAVPLTDSDTSEDESEDDAVVPSGVPHLLIN